MKDDKIGGGGGNKQSVKIVNNNPAKLLRKTSYSNIFLIYCNFIPPLMLNLIPNQMLSHKYQQSMVIML